MPRGETFLYNYFLCKNSLQMVQREKASLSDDLHDVRLISGLTEEN
jgi:hypothetical protein